MKHFLVEWRNLHGDYRSTILAAGDKEQACRLVRQAYVTATKMKARELAG